MKAFIHIGTEKTGSTSIQNCLLKNQLLLKQNGIGLVNRFVDENSRKLAAYCMVNENIDDFFINNGLLDINSRQKFKLLLKNEIDYEVNKLDGNSNIIISSEHFHSRLKSEEEVNNLKILLEKYFTDFEVIVYLRRQDLMAMSLYSTALKVGFSNSNILPVNISENDAYYNYDLLLTKWSNVFGKENITPVIFEKEKFINKDLLSDFFYRIGINTVDFKKPSKLNHSLAWQVQFALLSFNKILSREKYSNQKTRLNYLRNKLWTTLSVDYQGKSLKPLRNDAIKFYKIFEESNKRIGIKWFKTPNVFSDDFSMYPEEKEKHRLEPEILDVIFEVLKDEIIDS
ncbi:MAG: hypothetical protein ACOCUL_00065 [Bacteroidota bacterium]